MPRPRRLTPGGVVYHVLNRANGRRGIFDSAGDYLAFEQILADVQQRVGMRILAWCLMPNHWHLVLWPHRDGELSTFLRLSTVTHAQRWHAYRGTAGTGHLYQGRFKGFSVQEDDHFLTVCRYVEANALRAELVARAEDWRWGSLWQSGSKKSGAPEIADWPVPRPSDWNAIVNEAMSPAALKALRACARRGTPYGRKDWAEATARRLGVESTLRSRGRPKKKTGVQQFAAKGS